MSAALVESVRGLIACGWTEIAVGPDTHKESSDPERFPRLFVLDLPAILAALTKAEALRAQVAASQARERYARAFIERIPGLVQIPGSLRVAAEQALSAPTDTAALRAMLRHVATVAGREGMETTEALDELVDRVLGGS